MADGKGAGVCSSHVLLNSEGNDEVSFCKMCKEYEVQLKELLDELSSIQLINKHLKRTAFAYDRV
jgi:hypothetical protein